MELETGSKIENMISKCINDKLQTKTKDNTDYRNLKL